MSSPICIYCRTRGPSARFNREHVLQDGFGKFKGALVLRDAVCKDCNHYFSQSIDLALARESVEGLERYQWGVKRAEEIVHFNYDSITLRAGELGEFSGAGFKLVPGPGPKGLMARLLPGIAVHNTDDEGFTHFSKQEVLSGQWSTAKVNWRGGVRFYGDELSMEEMKNALAAQNVTLTKFRPIELAESGPQGIQVSQEFRITSEMRRGIAKIAFNYLAYRQGDAYVLNVTFDLVRNFIRHGIGSDEYFVRTTDDLPFRVDLPEGERPVVHWISLDSHRDHGNLLGVIMLFGFLEHTVMLAEGFPGPWFDIPVAHIYNVKTLKAEEMKPQIPLWNPGQNRNAN